MVQPQLDGENELDWLIWLSKYCEKFRFWSCFSSGKQSDFVEKRRKEEIARSLKRSLINYPFTFLAVLLLFAS